MHRFGKTPHVHLIIIVVVFQCLEMKEDELQQRIVDRVDILTDPVDERHYKEDEVSSTMYKP